MSTQSTRRPSWVAALLSALHAVVFLTAAIFLPWTIFSWFAVVTGLLGALHAASAIAILTRLPMATRIWRTTGFAALGYLAYFTYAALGSGLYVNQLYDGVGRAILAASLAAYAVGLLFTVPLAAWAIASTGGFSKRAIPIGSGAAIGAGDGLIAFGLAGHAAQARGQSRPTGRDGLLEELTRRAATREASGFRASMDHTLFTTESEACRVPPSRELGATVFVTFRPASTSNPQTLCVQSATASEATEKAMELAETATDAVLIDVVSSVRALPDANELVGAVILRPGQDGICAGVRCLLPWQTMGRDLFTEATNVSSLQAELGVTAPSLRRALRLDGEGFEGLDAIQTDTYIVRSTGHVERWKNLRGAPRTLNGETLVGAIEDATTFITSAQVKDGRFRYTVHPFTGETSFSNFSVPRQAGTTLALCGTLRAGQKVSASARSSLGFLAGLAQRHEGSAGIVYPKGKKARAPLGNTALSLIAMLSCRPLVGKAQDPVTVELLKGLLSMQEPDGRFAPAWNPENGERISGKDALYAAGQAVYALLLWEGPEGEGLERPSDLSERIDRAMAYYSGPYWDIPLRDFFYLEENWHCLAAKQALTYHRNDAYEEFCIRYMDMKKRFITRPADFITEGEEEIVGAYSFGALFPPHHAATSGFLEGLAASVALKRARGVPTADDEAVMRLSLSYLLHHQWRADNCALCTSKIKIVGGFSENIGSPIVRIDFVQHALSSMVHAGRALDLLPAERT